MVVNIYLQHQSNEALKSREDVAYHKYTLGCHNSISEKYHSSSGLDRFYKCLGREINTILVCVYN